MTLFSTSQLQSRIPLRMMTFAGLALLCHWLLWDGLSEITTLPPPHSSEQKEVTVQLLNVANTATLQKLTPVLTTNEPADTVTHAKAHAPKNEQIVEQQHAPSDSAVSTAALVSPSDTSQPAAISTKVSEEFVVTSTTSAVKTTQVAENQTKQEEVIDLSNLHIVPPPSGTMEMKLVYVAKNLNPVYGMGRIQWTIKDSSYEMHIDASLDLLLTTLRLYQLQSEGNLGQHGIAPLRMTESRRGRSETATHFHYDTKMISFSASANQVEMSAGTQDKASIFMQLAGIGVAAPEQFVSGKKMTIQVAENREAEKFQFVVQGQEEITTPLGKVQTWHVTRPPRPGFYNSTLELWFAPAYHWYPLQIRNTEPNGAVTTQTVTQIQFTPSLEH